MDAAITLTPVLNGEGARGATRNLGRSNWRAARATGRRAGYGVGC